MRKFQIDDIVYCYTEWGQKIGRITDFRKSSSAHFVKITSYTDNFWIWAGRTRLATKEEKIRYALECMMKDE